MDEADDEAPIKSVRKAIGVLDLLADARRPLRVSDVAAQLNMSVSGVSRLISTLAKSSLVYQDEDTGRCYLGLGLTVLGADALGRRGIDRIAMPIMDDLANRLDAYVGLGRLCRGKVVIMRALPTPASQHGVHITIVAPTHVCAPGKVLCGALGPGEITAMLATHGMDPVTSRTIVDPKRFIEVVEASRRDGYAIDDQESAYQVRHFACPILGHDGVVIATLSAGGAISDFTWDSLPSQIQTLSHACLRISRELGYRGEAVLNLEALNRDCEQAAAK